MQTTVTEAGPFERLLTLRLEESELDDAKTAAARKLSQSMKIKGFRPGKAPRAVVERMVGEETLRSEAIDEALPDLVGTALGETELAPVTTPRVEDIRDEEGRVEVDVRITLWPKTDAVPDYEDRKVHVELAAVTDDEIDDQLDRLRSQFAELEDVSREGDTGDFVMVNISATADGKPLDDVSADDLLYEIGSQSFIPGLDELLVGASAGDIREGPATLPTGFDAAGSEVQLRVLVKGVRGKKLPTVTDDWVSDISEFETVEELMSQLRENSRLMKLSVAHGQFQESLIGDLAEELDIDLPDALVEAEMEASIHNLAHSLEAQGLDLANYLRITGQDQEAFVAELRERSTRSLKTRILLESVANQEGIDVGADEIESAIDEMATSTGRDADELRQAIQGGGQEEALSSDILRRKALDRILEAATAVDGDGEPIDLSPPEGRSGDTEESSREASVDDDDDVADAAAEEPAEQDSE